MGHLPIWLASSARHASGLLGNLALLEVKWGPKDWGQFGDHLRTLVLGMSSSLSPGLQDKELLAKCYTLQTPFLLATQNYECIAC